MKFPNQLTLYINKRLKNEEDKPTITQLKQELFDKNNIPIDVLQKYFKVITNMKELQTTNNICYYNYRKKYINKYVFNKLVVKNKYNNSQISIYTDEKKKKGNGFLSKKINIVESEDILYYIGMVLTGKKYYIGTNQINNEEIKIYVNFQYVLDDINILQNYFTFHNINSDESIKLKIKHYPKKKDI